MKANRRTSAMTSHRRASVVLLMGAGLVACGGQLVVLGYDADEGATPNFDVVESSATAPSVDAPDYTLDVTGLVILTDVNNVIQSATGSATLGAGSVAGQRYVVADAGGLTAYAELDAAYVADSDIALDADIPAIDFALVDDDLSISQTRTLIVANIASGVRSYQAFEVTFHQASLPGDPL